MCHSLLTSTNEWSLGEGEGVFHLGALLTDPQTHTCAGEGGGDEMTHVSVCRHRLLDGFVGV